MNEAQITLPFISDFTRLGLYGTTETLTEDAGSRDQRQRGIILTWTHVKGSSRRLVGLGLDISRIERWQQMLARMPEVAARAFTAGEMQWAAARPDRLALLWTIKES